MTTIAEIAPGHWIPAPEKRSSRSTLRERAEAPAEERIRARYRAAHAALAGLTLDLRRAGATEAADDVLRALADVGRSVTSALNSRSTRTR